MNTALFTVCIGSSRAALAPGDPSILRLAVYDNPVAAQYHTDFINKPEKKNVRETLGATTAWVEPWATTVKSTFTTGSET